MNGAEIAEVAVLVVGGMLFETYLGVTPRFKANSTLELVYNATRSLYKLLRGAWTGRPQTEGVVRLSIEARNIITSESAEKLIAFLEELTCDIVDQKPKSEIITDLTNAIEIMPELKELAADYKADPEAVERALLLGSHKLVRRLMASLKARGASAAIVPGQ